MEQVASGRGQAARAKFSSPESDPNTTEINNQESYNLCARARACGYIVTFSGRGSSVTDDFVIAFQTISANGFAIWRE